MWSLSQVSLSPRRLGGLGIGTVVRLATMGSSVMLGRGARVLIDQDGPLADFERGFCERWQSAFPAEHYIPVHMRRVFKVKDDYPIKLRAKVEEIYLRPGFYRDLPVVQGALAAIDDMMGLGCEIFICSSPLTQYQHCVVEKFMWVEQYLGSEFTKRIIITKDKTIVKGDVLIDDAPHVDGVVKEPEWKRYLFDAPYNRAVADVPRLTWRNWRSVLGA